ncbi:MAG: hypothetical protein SVV80_14250, partial [Planctomycetota bacterium]|nr:hypothetical protein [Planctomycetota bacterium]
GGPGDSSRGRFSPRKKCDYEISPEGTAEKANGFPTPLRGWVYWVVGYCGLTLAATVPSPLGANKNLACQIPSGGWSG